MWFLLFCSLLLHPIVIWKDLPSFSCSLRGMHTSLLLPEWAIGRALWGMLNITTRSCDRQVMLRRVWIEMWKVETHLEDSSQCRLDPVSNVWNGALFSYISFLTPSVCSSITQGSTSGCGTPPVSDEFESLLSHKGCPCPTGTTDSNSGMKVGSSPQLASFPSDPVGCKSSS
jgi:hypothetical protein